MSIDDNKRKRLRVLCNKLPKIELHAHLSGSITRECLQEIWLQKQPNTLPSPLIAIPDGKVDYDLVTFFPLFTNYIYKLCNDIPSIKYSTAAVLRDFEQDGVVYLELRTTPREFADTGLTKAQYVEGVIESIEEHNATSMSMRTYLILSIDRRDTPEKAQECIDLAIRYQSRGVVGVDLCGDPLAGDMSLLAPHYRQAHQHGLKVTLHFAEIVKNSSDKELLQLLSFNPQRLGHVIHVSKSIRAELERRKVALELCVSCNVHAKMLVLAGTTEEEQKIGTFGDHHFGRWWEERKCPVVICTDDVGVFCSTLSNEYSLVAEHFKLSKTDIWDLAYSAIDIIFAGEKEKERLKKVFIKWKESEEGRELLASDGS